MCIISYPGMAAIPESVGHGDGEYHKPVGGGSFEMGKTTDGHQV